ncbi:MAG: hypothetical protein IKP34_06930 [Bacteroidales bacterium]|nr:hypothetical protein [Bacteroidales bacterium]MBR4715894.1 hypothetical protein [Bacteroidales bacterium]
MIKQNHIKSLFLASAFVLLSVACVLTVKYWHRTLPAEFCGEVYQRYAGREDLYVSFIKDFRIDDSTVVDVTTLTAKDSAGWEALLREMNRSEETIKQMREDVDNDNNPITMYPCEIGHPELICSDPDKDKWLVFMIHTERTVYVFQTINEKQSRVIRTYKMKEAINKSIKG